MFLKLLSISVLSSWISIAASNPLPAPATIQSTSYLFPTLPNITALASLPHIFNLTIPPSPGIIKCFVNPPRHGLTPHRAILTLDYLATIDKIDSLPDATVPRLWPPGNSFEYQSGDCVVWFRSRGGHDPDEAIFPPEQLARNAEAIAQRCWSREEGEESLGLGGLMMWGEGRRYSMQLTTGEDLVDTGVDTA